MELRDSIVLGSTRAGILALGGGTPGGFAAVRHTDFFGNARDAEGRPDPAGSDGNLSADPLFADLAAGDLQLLPGIALRRCRIAPDAGHRAPRR